uniref:Uncharacterized protein n=1 Tax=Anopheles epiroticus TaxID=199890 RepID=A0A182P392_9DIPT
MEPSSAMHALYLLLVCLLLCRVSRGEWVEIQQLKPSSPAVTSTISTTIKPATINGHVLAHSHLLLSHLSDDRERLGGRWSSSGGGTVSSSSMQWHRPVSDLLDYDGQGKRVSHPVPAWITTTTRQHVYAQHTPVTLVNVSNKVEELNDNESDQEENDEQYPIVQTELLPFGNRYEEESIESVTDTGAPKAIIHAAASPGVEHHFDDFDDYDERLPLAQTEGKPPDSAEEEYVEEEEPYETEEGQGIDEQPEPPKKLHVRPAAPMGLGGFLEFLRRMQASFVQRTAHTIGDKIRTLAGMRDQLLSTIERRISALWRGDPPQTGGKRRVRRGWMEPHADTEAMDFPSAEGALLTISFLTFAVFLIKLVLQVINTIKAKHYTYSTFAAATPVSGGLLVKRTRRHTLDPHELQALLGALDGFRPT